MVKAMAEAGIEAPKKRPHLAVVVPRCVPHSKRLRCAICDHAYRQALHQQQGQLIVEQRAAHAEYIARGGVVR
jgi:hypothetical protein